MVLAEMLVRSLVRCLYFRKLGGRVNRVGYTRKTIEGTFQNYGIFSDYTEDSVNFDTDSELMTHINREDVYWCKPSN